MESYGELKARHTKELEAIPLVYAFGDNQWDEGMRALGLTPGDTDKVVSTGELGVFCLAGDYDALSEVYARHKRELQEAIQSDLTGDNFIRDMFLTELRATDFDCTHNEYEALDVLHMKMGQIEADPRLHHGLEAAKKECLE